ncbi:hypothetical protein [Sphingomonas sp.]|uniref:hypothetical protein n=1 Tax=Sphingomonas sp. TaxID=28214 RepID=UPI003CC5C9EB
MSDNRGLTPGEQMTRRAQQVAMGLADAGLSQAEEMLRRVSPEGRARARAERERRRRARNRVLGRVGLAVGGALLVLIALASVLPGGIAFVASVMALAVLLVVLMRNVDPAVPQRAALPAADLRQLPAQASAWLGSQIRALPAPAVPLADALGRRLEELAPQLARLSPQEPAADAVRKLLGTELPALVDGWHAVPPSLRAQPRPDGRTPDTQLMDGLHLIDSEVARMTEQLARGALDEVATQGRYLELKYGDS